MKRLSLVPATIFVVLCFFACTHKPFAPVQVLHPDSTVHTVDSTHTGDTTHTVDVVDTAVCFQRDILPIFLGSCAMSGCHDATTRKDGYNLTSYATIVYKGLVKGNAASSKLYTKCVSGSMPQYPVPKLDSTKLSLLRRWINNGATNDTNCAVNCDTSKYTYAGAIAPLLNTYCYSCHAAAAAGSVGGGIVLDNYAAVLVQANNGKLLADVQHASGSNYMPLGGTKLSDCKITQIAKWIAAGAPNN